MHSRYAQTILQGYHSFTEAFLALTRQAEPIFAGCDWEAGRQNIKDRINLYPKHVAQTAQRVSGLLPEAGLAPSFWQDSKLAYAEFLPDLPAPELAETFYNSVYCHIADHHQINNRNLFVLPTRLEQQPAKFQSHFTCYGGDKPFAALLDEIIDNVAISMPFANRERDMANMLAACAAELPEQICNADDTRATVYRSVFYRSFAADIVGEFVNGDARSPFVIVLHNNGNGQLVVDTMLFHPEDFSVIFSYTRAAFNVHVPVPSEVVNFLQRIMPWKSRTEAYASIGARAHCKTQLYRDLTKQLDTTADQFIIAPGVPGMAMFVFLLPSFNFVFKIIKDRFASAKTINHATVKKMYRFVAEHTRCGRMANTLEFENFEFPLDRFSPALLQKLKAVIPSQLTIEGNALTIKHLYAQRYMQPLNLYLNTASEADAEHAINEYGIAIKELSAANVFPGDMLFKNFGVTRHKRVVFYDYDEIMPLTECNFRRIPEPKTPEQEMASEPWYSIAPNDVFPEEFRVFLTASNPLIREIFDRHHSAIFDADWWQGLQQDIIQGKIRDVIPYSEDKRFPR